MTTEDTMPAKIGQSYVTREGKIVGPLRLGHAGMEDHLEFNGRFWHRDGTACGARCDDLVESCALNSPESPQ